MPVEECDALFPAGFRGLADKDADGHVSGSELFDHLGTSLQQDGGRLGGKQSPVRFSPR